jgi:predicted transposase YbfD/YdcC
MERVRKKFEQIKDERHQSYVEYKLADVLILVMCSVLCGIDQLEEIVSYGKNKSEFLRKTFSIERIPSKPTISRILNIVDPDEVSTIVIEIMREHVSEIGEIVAVDGKAIRSTSTKGRVHSALQILTAYCTESGVIIGQEAIVHEDKTNEIPVFQEMLTTLDVKGKTITADAMHCQTKTCEKIVKKGGNYCFGLKENQKTFYEDVKLYYESKTGLEMFTTCEKHNGRVEKRTCHKFRDIDWLEQRKDWMNLRSVFAVNRIITTKHGTSEETGFYISSLDESPEKLLQVVREHWKIESLHWLLDVVFTEDDCNLKNDEGQRTLNGFRKLSLLVHKSHIAKQPKKRTIKGNMFDCLLTDHKLVKVIENL